MRIFIKCFSTIVIILTGLSVWISVWWINDKSTINPDIKQMCTHNTVIGSIDAVNLIIVKNKPSIGMYLVSALPFIIKDGSDIKWLGEHAASIYGAPTDKVLLIAKYKSPQTFCNMVLSPYYIKVSNRLRERGERFLHSVITQVNYETGFLPNAKHIIAVFVYNKEHAKYVKQQLSKIEMQLIYENHKILNMIEHPKLDSEPHPIPYEVTLIFAWDGNVATAKKMFDQNILKNLADSEVKFSVQAYKKISVADLLLNN